MMQVREEGCAHDITQREGLAGVTGIRCMRCGRWNDGGGWRAAAEHPFVTGVCGCHPERRTGGGHDPDCPEFEVDCTCYEAWAGHQPGCPRANRGYAAAP